MPETKDTIQPEQVWESLSEPEQEVCIYFGVSDWKTGVGRNYIEGMGIEDKELSGLLERKIVEAKPTWQLFQEQADLLKSETDAIKKRMHEDLIHIQLTDDERKVLFDYDNYRKVADQKSDSAKGKKRIENGILYVQSTYNNTLMLLTDEKGNALAASSSGALGFKGAKKGTPFAAAKVGETLAGKAQGIGIKDVMVVVKGVGSGRESSIRSFASKGFGIKGIRDETPIPHNGPRPPKPRRV